MLAPQPGVRVGVPATTSLLSRSYQARQFEYHYSLPLMGIGTINGEVMLSNWETQRVLGCELLPGATTPIHEPASVLALSWLRHSPDRLIAGCSTGRAAMYRVTESALRADADDFTSSSSVPSGLQLQHAYSSPLTDQMTSLHCNSTDTLLCASGYTYHVNVLDIETGQMLRSLRNIHSSHVNIARFANHMPYLLLTCSFDRKLHMFDVRSNARVERADTFGGGGSSPVPIYTCESTTGNVMVCFSPNDQYFLSSAVDNEVKQYHVVDGTLSLEYAIPKQRLQTNYTRSYYLNEGEAIISGSSASDLLYVCSSVDGEVLDTVDMVESRRDDHLYIQSLRGCPLPDQHNRCTVLVCYRKQTIANSYELIEVNMNRSPSGAPRDHPLSLSSIIAMADDSRRFLNDSFAADVVISCAAATGTRLIYAHQAILRARWPWFAKHAVWSDEAAQVRQTATAAATKKKDPDSLDDDEDDEMPIGGAASSDNEPLVFCRIVVPHGSTGVANSAATSSNGACDILTLSSTGMVSIEFPQMTREQCLYLLNFLYTGGVPMQSEESALSTSKSAVETAEARRRADLSRARRHHDFEAIAAARRDEERRSEAAEAEALRGLDDDENDEAAQRAMMASVAGLTRAAHSNGNADASATMDVHAALVSLSLRATPSTAATTLSPAATPIPPLSAAFSAKLALFALCTPKQYDLPRLANILERGMRKQICLGVDAVETEKNVAESASATSAASAASSAVAAPGRSPAIESFHRRVSACVRLGAHGLISVAQDLIERAYDWLAVRHSWFIDDLDRLFPSSPESRFVDDLRKRRQECMAVKADVQIMQTSFAVVTAASSSSDDSPSSLVLWTGGSTQKTTPPMGPLCVLETRTLRTSEIQCAATTHRYAFDDGLTSHASSVLHADSSSPDASHFVVVGGQTTKMEGRLRVLDLRTLVWADCELEAAPRARKKHTMAVVPALRRAFVFGGRDSHHVFGDMRYLDYAGDTSPDQWTWVSVQELHQMQGRTGLVNPAVRYSHTCTYSRSVGGLVLFGGNSVAGCRNDVWVFDTADNRWTCKRPNDPALLQNNPDSYALHVRTHGETQPLPRLSHSASIVEIEGEEHLAVFGGVTAFVDGQMVHNDLWLLHLGNFTWRRVHATSPPPAVDMEDDIAEDLLREAIAADEMLLPTRRWEHTSFLMPLADPNDIKKDDDGGSTSSTAATVTPLPDGATPLRANGRIAVMGGTTMRYAVPWVDVFDFATLSWSREVAHPATMQLQPSLNIEDRGRLWVDMQQRFRQTQPEPFAAPLVTDADIDATGLAKSSADGSDALDAAVATPVPSASCTLDACIQLNLSYERALFPRATPLPASSYVHFLVEGRVLTVPKVILASRCATFLSMLTSSIRDANLIERSVIKLDGVRYIIFRCILYWVYCGDEEFEIDVRPRTASSLAAQLGASATGGSSPGSSSSRGTKRACEDLSDSDELSLGALAVTDLERAVSAGKKCKNGHGTTSSSTDLTGLDEEPATAWSPTVPLADPSVSESSTYVIDPLELLVAADRFNLTSLCAVLEIGLSRQIEVAVVCKFLYFSEIYHLRMLQQRCTIFIIQHYEEITTTYASEYATLDELTRLAITSGLHALAGSHRGPNARNEPNPLLQGQSRPQDEEDDEELMEDDYDEYEDDDEDDYL